MGAPSLFLATSMSPFIGLSVPVGPFLVPAYLGGWGVSQVGTGRTAVTEAGPGAGRAQGAPVEVPARLPLPGTACSQCVCSPVRPDKSAFEDRCWG